MLESTISKVVFVLVLIAALNLNADEPTRPNVIFVLADDLGIGDLQPTNPDCKIKTPYLQQMADEGITFLDAHSPSAVCTPTRYGVLTGRYNWRSRLAKGVLGGTSDHLIPADRPTVARMLQNAGYHTQMIGKWHLGWDWATLKNEEAARKKKRVDLKNIDFSRPVKNGPDINGFDGYYGHCGSLDMPPYVWVNTGNVTAVPTREEGVTRGEDAYGWYRKGPISPDFEIDNVLPHLFQKGIEYIKDRAPAAKNGKPFFLYLPLPAPHTPIVPVPPFKDASGMNPYADFVMQVDHHMGELFAALKDAGIDDNTIVFFTSDNGCSNQANFDVLKKHEHDPSGGYRGHKADIFEGGHRVPFIARWPISIKAGQKTNALACLTDLYATLQDVTGQPVQDVGGEDSFSLRPAFDGDAMTNRKTLISHSIGGSFSIRQGDWKLCLCAGSGGWSAPKEPEAKKQNLPLMQLYNLKEDRGERNNLVNKHPERVQALLKLLNEEVSQGRCTPGKGLSNDRDVKFLPAGVELPVSDEQPVAADSFIGHWALTIPKGRAGWLGVTEVNGKLDASILWGGGSVVPVASTKIENGQLVVTREQIQKGGVNKGKKIVETITATRDGENLNLVTVKTRPDGKEFAKAEFTGKLTHPMPSPDLSKVKFGAPVTLFNGKDLSGWKALSPNAGMGWGVEDGVLINRTHQEGKPHRPHTNIRTEQEFEDFNLTVEARTLKDSNSGIYLRGIYEIQIFESYGKPVDSHNMGALYSRVCPSVAAEKPVGEWQSLDITLVDKHVTVILNGQTIIDNQPALGCTGGALWSDPDRSGPIYLQGNHSDIDFRNMVLRPVLKQ